MYSPRVTNHFRSFALFPVTRPQTWLPALTAALVLASCAPPRELAFDPAAAEVGTVERIIVATDRAPGIGLPLFTHARQDPPHFLAFDISVPPDRDAGVVTYPRRGRPEPRFDFLTVATRELDGVAGFIAAVNRDLTANPANDGEASLFVHGYNTSFAQGLYRQAQLDHDTGSRVAQVHYAWPSDARIGGYLYDRESVLFSRGGLETTIAALGRTEATHYTLAAHSMGTLLLMDTLHLMARVGYPEIFERTESVLLISPDIEIDVFRRLAPPVIARGVPIVVIVSRHDRALLASSLVRGERRRVGSVHSTEELGVPGVRVIDISDVRDPGFSGHFAVATSPELLTFLRSLEGGGLVALDRATGPFATGAAIVRRGAGLVLAPLTDEP